MNVAVASTSLDLLGNQAREFIDLPHRMLINGDWVDAVSGATLPVIDPATGAEVARFPDAGEEDVDRAVRAARAAFEDPAWVDMIPAKRERLLLRLADLIEENAEQLSELEALDNGKSVVFARAIDVNAGSVAFCRYVAGWATKLEGSTFDVSMPEFQENKFQTYTRREPVGVVAGIVPWNFPLSMAVWKITPAIATGCTIVLKPAEETSLTALRLGELIKQAGIPDGVVNIVTGRGETAGAALVAHPGIDKIAFTGSTEVGKIIGKRAMEDVKRVSLELGGKSPAIVFPDADLELAIPGAASAIFFNQGEVCCAGSRLFVHRRLFDQVVEGVADFGRNMKMGPGLDPSTQIGPLVSETQLDRVSGYVRSGVEEGAEVISGGDIVNRPGYFYEPTVFVNTTPTMKIFQDEIFGPVVCAVPYDDIEEVVAAANDTHYGLAASVWTRDLNTAHEMIAKLRAGTVWVNCHNLLDPNMPWGGFKQSGLGRELGHTVLDLYTELKSVCIKYR